MRVEDIKQENEKYYYCDNYIWSLRKVWILPFIFITVMGLVSNWINKLFLKEYFFRQAATQEIGSIDVAYWIQDKIDEGSKNEMTILIIIVSIAVAISVVPFAFRWVKSYNSYKYGMIKLIPIGLYIAEILVMWMFYYFDTSIFLLMIATILNLLPAIISSRLLYPLESRPYEDGKLDFIRGIFDCAAKFILKRL